MVEGHHKCVGTDLVPNTRVYHLAMLYAATRMFRSPAAGAGLLSVLLWMVALGQMVRDSTGSSFASREPRSRPLGERS
jgi:hypothetical protein